MYILWKERSSRSSPARRFRTVLRATEFSIVAKCTAITARPIGPRSAGFYHQRTRKTIRTHSTSPPVTDDGMQWDTAKESKESRNERKMTSKQFARILRSETSCHDTDGACTWRSVTLNIRNRLPNIDPNVTAEEWLEQILTGIER